MNIALIGYGKMGKTIDQMAQERGHTIVLKADREEIDSLSIDTLRKAQVAIEFTQPDAAVSNIDRCFAAGIPIVCGTTGWYERKPEVEARCLAGGHTLFTASNFSIGVNILFAINERLAELMNLQPAYREVLVHETHHIQKLDAPSGTAISLAEQIVSRLDRLHAWHSYRKDESVTAGPESRGELPVFSSREDDVPGTHVVKYVSEADEIELVHKAYNRTGFAAGALMAAEWVVGKRGVFGMRDLLSL
jgi:4-hydroxy-tetrahydrodipicolinate reductase